MTPSTRILRNATPNLLTASRLAMGLGFFWAPVSWRLPLLAAALLTEYLDGALARRWNATSRWGALMDPIADKVFVVAVALTCVSDRLITWPQLTLVIARDLIVLVGAVWLLALRDWGRLRALRPRWSGKWATVGQFAILITLIAIPEWTPGVLPVAISLSLIAAIDYAIHFLRDLATPR